MTQNQKWSKIKNGPKLKMTTNQKWPKFENDPNSKMTKIQKWPKCMKWWNGLSAEGAKADVRSALHSADDPPFFVFLSFSCIYVCCGSLCSLGSMWAQQSYSAVLHLHLWWYYYIQKIEEYGQKRNCPLGPLFQCTVQGHHQSAQRHWMENIARIANAVPCHSLFKGHNVNVNIVVLNCHKCNQCLKCQVSGHKSLGLLSEGALWMSWSSS